MFNVNEDYVNSADDSVSAGRRVGFMQGFDTAYKASVYEATNKSNEIVEMFYQQNQQLKSMGEQNVPGLDFFTPLTVGGLNVRDLERVYSGEEPFYQTQEEFDSGLESMRRYDAHIEELRKKYPDAQLRDSREMVEAFQSRAREAAEVEASQRRTTMGSVGAFIGGAAAGLDPRYNLLNTLTLGVGGVGRKVITRVGTEAAAQSGIEALNELTGGRTVREMRGLESSWGGTFTRIGFAGVGGGVVRGVGEGIGAGVRAGRRWFTDFPNDPAPPPPPPRGESEQPDFTVGADGVARPTASAPTPEAAYAIRKAALETVDATLARTRTGSARVIEDLEYVRQRLDAWDGETPAALRPRTDTAMPDARGVRFADDATTRAALGRETLDEAARRADPEAFRVYDTLVSKVETIRAELATAKPDTKEWGRLITEANNKVVDLTERLGNRRLGKAERAQLTAERDAAMAERDTVMAQPRDATDTPRAAELRERLQKYDYKLRDLAPVVNRAYARARGSFVADAKTRDAVKRMVDSRSTRLADEDVEGILADAQRRMREDPPRPDTPLADAPIVRQATAEDLGPDNDFVRAAKRVVERDAKRADETLTAFRDSLGGVLKEGNEKVTIGTHEFNLNDKLEVAGIDGEGSRTITVREMLEEMQEADYELKAMKTCSI